VAQNPERVQTRTRRVESEIEQPSHCQRSIWSIKFQLLPPTKSRALPRADGIKVSQRNTSRVVQLRSSADAKLSVGGLKSPRQNPLKVAKLSRRRTPLIKHLLSLLKLLSHKGINDLGGNCSVPVTRPLTRLHMYNNTSP